jgi:hypothetical protein
MSDSFSTINFSSADERERLKGMVHLIEHCPIPPEERMDNMGLFLNSKTLSQVYGFMYQKIVEVPGVVMEFGTRWGQNTLRSSQLYVASTTLSPAPQDSCL